MYKIIGTKKLKAMAALLARYTAWLQRSPLKSNMISMGGIMLVGDATAQAIEGKRSWKEYDKLRATVMVTWCSQFYQHSI